MDKSVETSKRIENLSDALDEWTFQRATIEIVDLFSWNVRRKTRRWQVSAIYFAEIEWISFTLLLRFLCDRLDTADRVCTSTTWTRVPNATILDLKNDLLLW